MSGIKKPNRESVVRRWGFYSGNRLAFAGEARQSSEGELRLHFIEAAHLADIASLPQRLGFEQSIREMVRSDIKQAMGPDWEVPVQFDPCKLNEHDLATDVFGGSQPGVVPVS